jgi:SNF2 family DNA or RNA helicase
MNMPATIPDFMPPMFQHQADFAEKWYTDDLTLNFSDAGSGKTRAVLETLLRRKREGKTTKKTLVLAPLSILRPAWAQDIDKWTPDLTYSIAYAKNRSDAICENVDIVISNHDAVKWLSEHREFLPLFDTLVIDESTAYKNYSPQRAKAARLIAPFFKYRCIMTGTPNPKSIVDLWSQVYIVDLGARLGKNFYSFQNQVQRPVFVTPTIKQWVDKDNAEEVVTAMISDITFRVKLEDCIDMPENIVNDISIDIDPKVREQYTQLLNDSIIELDTGTIDAVNAGARFRKLLQMLTGQIYDRQGAPHFVHSQRYDLVIDLVQARKQCLVAFNFKHERDKLVNLCQKQKITYGVIDGDAPEAFRTELVRRFQEGTIKVLFCHPQSAGHGLTLTNATTTIWASPTYNAEHYEQFNRRFYRAGQKKKTETIRISARDTLEEVVYEKLDDKRAKLLTTLQLLKELSLAQLHR